MTLFRPMRNDDFIFSRLFSWFSAVIGTISSKVKSGWILKQPSLTSHSMTSTRPQIFWIQFTFDFQLTVKSENVPDSLLCFTSLTRTGAKQKQKTEPMPWSPWLLIYNMISQLQKRFPFRRKFYVTTSGKHLV